MFRSIKVKRCTSLTLSRGAVHHWIIWLARMTHSGIRHRYDTIYDTIYDMSEREMEMTGLHWLSSSWCHIPVRLLDYRRAWILCSNHQHQEIAPHIVQQIESKKQKQKNKGRGCCDLCLVLGIPGVWRVNLQCGRAVSACIRAHTGLFRLSPSLSPSPDKPHTSPVYTIIFTQTFKEIHCRLFLLHETLWYIASVLVWKRKRYRFLN